MDKESNSLCYGWWERKNRVNLPKTLGHPKNYVLTPEELEQYNELMQAVLVATQKEAAAVRLNHRAMGGGKPFLVNLEGTPRCTTIAHVLEHMVADSKHKLALMHFLNDAAKKRVEAREAELRG